MQSSAENLHYVFDIGDHPTVVTCLPIAAESFRLKSGLIVQMDGRKAKFSPLDRFLLQVTFHRSQSQVTRIVLPNKICFY